MYKIMRKKKEEEGISQSYFNKNAFLNNFYSLIATKEKNLQWMEKSWFSIILFYLFMFLCFEKKRKEKK